MKAKVVVAIAIILGLITSVLVYTMLGTPDLQEQEAKKVVAVVVAKENINPRQKITAEMLNEKEIPEKQAHFEAFKSVDKVKGRYASAKIVAGEQVLKSRLYSKEETNSMLALNLGPKKRAVTVAVNEVIGVAGFLMPGDYVDVVAVFSDADNAVAKAVLQNVKVLAVAQDMTTNQGMKPEVKKSVTLAVGLEEAERLALADREGEIRLALRSPKNQIKSGSTGFSLNKLLGRKEEATADNSDAEETETTEQESTEQDKKTVIKEKEEQTKKEEISKKVEIIRGTKKVYEDILIKEKEGQE
ncbi:Flp pilus assembly protein CpaB [Halanaerobacter jeridensis]|uniref:Pilus assembly protein CpaB n=1 Tax=Halanaerobacter jeridensis TaxID=706427 RepID=A0A938XUM9_9FIRM|nr:Flp pilus assembly protein CpaB [Halanaerobacter jeridensis]MBM7557194.1 pilus assembly protein CpaB [Halanaerobacter jeridensis]